MKFRLVKIVEKYDDEGNSLYSMQRKIENYWFHHTTFVSPDNEAAKTTFNNEIYEFEQSQKNDGQFLIADINIEVGFEKNMEERSKYRPYTIEEAVEDLLVENISEGYIREVLYDLLRGEKIK